MPWKKALPLAWLALLSAMLLAGCSGSEEAASLSYEGDDVGSHNDSAECDGDGTLVASGHIDEGAVEVVVMDAQGETIYEETFNDDIDLDAEHLEGDKGDWELSATRVPDELLPEEAFDGEYDIRMTC